MPTTIATDSFDRADGALGANWATGVGAFEISSNAARSNAAADGYAYWVGAGTFSDNQYAKGTLGAVASGESGSDNFGGYAVRGSASGAYVVQVSSTRWFLATLTSGGSFGILTQGTWTASAGDLIEIEAEGTTIRAKRNGVEFTTTTDDTYASGAPGVTGYKVASGTTMADWEGGNMGDSGPAMGTMTTMRGIWGP